MLVTLSFPFSEGWWGHWLILDRDRTQHARSLIHSRSFMASTVTCERDCCNDTCIRPATPPTNPPP
jgi:hypothetical protein